MPSVEALPRPRAQHRLARSRSRGRRHGTPANDGAADPAPEDPDYRHIVLQAQLHRRNLAVALEDLDLLKYVRYVGHLSGWYLDGGAARASDA